MKKYTNLLPMNIQFFAEEDDPGNGNQNNDQGNNNSGNSNNDNGGSEKTFTQEQVSAMMAKEKNEGRKAMLKMLGYASEEEAKEAAALLKKLQDAQKPDEEKLKDDVKKAEQSKLDAEARAKEAEDKLTCITEGVNKDSISDVLAIASGKVTDDKPLEKVLKEMKKESRYAPFFVSASGDDTGHEPGHNNNAPKAGELGKRLGENVSNGQVKKSNFFQ